MRLMPVSNISIIKHDADPNRKNRSIPGDIIIRCTEHIESSWREEKDMIIYAFTVPGNTTATLYLPVPSLRDVREGRNLSENAKKIKRGLVKEAGR